jgi:hypothetical protein
VCAVVCGAPLAAPEKFGGVDLVLFGAAMTRASVSFDLLLRVAALRSLLCDAHNKSIYVFFANDPWFLSSALRLPR